MGFLSKFSTVIGDTHAANLTGSDTHAASVAANASASGAGAAGAVAVTWDSDAVTWTATEADLATSGSVTPGAAVNVIGFAVVIVGESGGLNNTVTLRVKEDTTTLLSFTTAALTSNDTHQVILKGSISNVTVAAHTYKATIQCAVSGTFDAVRGAIVVLPFSGSLTGSDTHAATLTGSEGTCL